MDTKKYIPVWQEQFTVRSFDIGWNATMRLSSICSYFQEIAGKHATHLDAGYQYMSSVGRVWVLSRLFMEIKSVPSWNQSFYAETWPLGTERIFFRRDYRIYDGPNTLINSTSYWILMDLKTRRPCKFDLDPGVLNANQGRYAMEMPREAFPPVKDSMASVHKVVYSDLDQNHHVNNARYVEWILDALDREMLERSTPASFAIEYKHEVIAGEYVEIRISETEKNAFAVEGIIQNTDQVCFRSMIRFR